MTNVDRRAVLTGLAAGVGLMATGRPAWALETDAAEAFVEDVAQRLVSLIRSDGGFESKRIAFRDLMNDSAAMPQIARFALGSAWSKMSDPQKAEYLELFPEYLSRIYTKRFDEYAGETLVVVGSQDRGDRGVFVDTRVERPGAEPLQVEWRVTDRAGPILIVDIYIEGISLLTTQREDFRGQFERSGNNIPRFLARLKELTVAS